MENMGLIKNQRKPRRRAHRRKLLPSDSPMDMAEARREIVNALHIHRSSSSWMLSSSSSLCDHYKRQENSSSLNLHTNTSKSSSLSSSSTTTGSQLYCPLVEPGRFPEPIWSTTEPASASVSTSTSTSASAAATSAELDDQEVVLFEEFEWQESNLSSHTWWLGFLRSLDSNNKDGSSANHHIQTSSSTTQSSASDESELLMDNIMVSLSTTTNQNEQNPHPEAEAAAAYHEWLSTIRVSDQDNEVEIY